MEYAHRNPAEFAKRVAGVLFVSTTAEGTTHTKYGLPPRLAMLLRAGETLGAGVLARFGPWRPHKAVMPVLRPGLRWLLFGDEYEGADLDLTVRGVGLATLRSIGGFRPSIGAQKRLETLTDLGDVPTAVLVGDRDRLTPPDCARSIADALPGSGLTVFPGAGHMLLLERQQDVSAVLTKIVQRAAKTPKAAKLEEAA
jgi:pimeloyl-ACP methyl ester carboxylesterase